jgi:tRNA(adenine34) deaminase
MQHSGHAGMDPWLNAPPLRRFLRSRGAAQAATESDARAMRDALSLAREAAAAGEAPIGAVIYDTATGVTIARARNTREGENDPAGHAEISAIRAAARALGDWRLNGFTLVVTLEPCCMCAGAIVAARLGRVVYAADDPKAGAARSLYRLLEDPRLNHRVTPIRGLLAGESAGLLREFFRQRRGPRPAE